MTETSQLTETVTLGEIYWDGYSAADSAYDGRVPYSALGPAVRAAIETGALAVATASRDSDSEPKPATVIVVTETPVGDRAPVERRYAATQWDDSEYTRLRIIRSGHQVASYADNAYLSVREDGATTADPYYSQGRKLAIALDALREIGDRFISDDLDEDLCRVLDKIAGHALEQIAELDL